MFEIRDCITNVLSSALPWFTESQNFWGWKGPLEAFKSNASAKAGSRRAVYKGMCPGDVWMSLERETPRPPWASFSSALPPSTGPSETLGASHQCLWIYGCYACLASFYPNRLWPRGSFPFSNLPLLPSRFRIPEASLNIKVWGKESI